MKKGRQHGSILIVEDNLHEQLLIKEAFQEMNLPDAIHTVNDGDDAIEFMKGLGKYADREKFRFPTFLLTDLKMPKVNGFELLLFLKRSNLIIIPVIVLTNSTDQDDINKSYQLGANAYHSKPMQMEGLSELLRDVYRYWMSLDLPDVDESGNLKPVPNANKISEKLRHPVQWEKPTLEDVLRNPTKINKAA